ncbi:regulatory protein RecX [Aliikangiella sp. IMCC44632]
MLNQDEQPKKSSKQLNRAIKYACRLLGVREYANKEIALKLQSKGFDACVVTECLEYLKLNNWLNESRYCESYIRFKSARGIGKQRINHELTQKQVDAKLAQQAMQQAQVDWQALCDSVLIKKTRSMVTTSLAANFEELSAQHAEVAITPIKQNLKQYRQLQRFLQYRGFDSQQIRASMNKFIVLGETSGEHDE